MHLYKRINKRLNMPTDSDAVSLGAALDARKGGVHRGIPPLGLYWTLREHGAAIAAMAEQQTSYRVIRTRINASASPMTIRSALERMRDGAVYEIVATERWDSLAKLIFANFPGFENMDFYKAYVLPGKAGYDAWQTMLKSTAKRRGRKKGSKNHVGAGERPKRQAVDQPIVPEPILPETPPPPQIPVAPAVAGSNAKTRELSGRRVIA